MSEIPTNVIDFLSKCPSTNDVLNEIHFNHIYTAISDYTRLYKKWIPEYEAPLELKMSKFLEPSPATEDNKNTFRITSEYGCVVQLNPHAYYAVSLVTV